jgi:calcium/calmodulin-dependent protein kinase I
MVKLANRIEALRKQEEDPDNSDLPKDATLAADQSRHGSAASAADGQQQGNKRQLSKAIKSAIFREVVLAKVREMKEQEQTKKIAEEAARKSTM